MTKKEREELREKLSAGAQKANKRRWAKKGARERHSSVMRMIWSLTPAQRLRRRERMKARAGSG